MNKINMLFAILPIVIGITTAISVGKTSVVPAAGTMDASNPPITLNVDTGGNDSFIEGDTVSYNGWTYWLTLSNTDIETIYAADVTMNPDLGTTWETWQSIVTVSYYNQYGENTLTADVDVFVESSGGGEDPCEFGGCEEDPSAESLTFNSYPYLTEYSLGDSLDLTGLSVIVYFSDGGSQTFEGMSLGSLSLEDEDNNSVWEGDSVTLKFATITVIYTDAYSSPVYDSFSLTIIGEKTPYSLTILSAPNNMDYFVGDEFDLTGLSVSVTYSDSSTLTLENSTLSKLYITNESGLDVTTNTTVDLSFATITVSYTEVGSNQVLAYFYPNITESVPEQLSIYSRPTKTTFLVGDSVDYAGLVVQMSFTNGDIQTFSDLGGDDLSLSLLDFTDKNNGSASLGSSVTMDFEVIKITYTNPGLYSTDVSTFFNMVIHEAAPYSYDFRKSLLDYHEFDPSYGRDELQLGQEGDLFLFKADNNAQNLLMPVTIDATNGFTIGDGATNPTTASFLSKFVWGTNGSSTGKGTINKLLINVSAQSATTMTLKINNVIVSTNSVNSSTDMNENYIVLDLFVLLTNVRKGFGHIEISFSQPGGESPISIKEMHVFSNGDDQVSTNPEATSSIVFDFVGSLETLLTCGDRNGPFIFSNTDNYNLYAESYFGYVWDELMLIDFSSDPSNPLFKDELRVKVSDKWNMIYALTTSAPGTGSNIEQTISTISPVAWTFLLLLLVSLPSAIFFISKRREI